MLSARAVCSMPASVSWYDSSGIAAVTGLLIYEHGLVKPTDLSKVNAAFFTMNGWVSVLFFVFWAADIFLTSHPL